MPATDNHAGAKLYPAAITNYINTELKEGAIMGPFTLSPFTNRIGVSPLSTRPKRNSQNKIRIIMDLSFPPGRSVNDGIEKDSYCGWSIKLVYPTIDTLAKRIAIIATTGKVLVW